MEYYKAILPAARNEIADLHRCEPYGYAQMIAGKESPKFGQAKNSWLTGTAAWNFVAVSQYILGVRLDYDGLVVDPCIPAKWKEFTVTRQFRGATYRITVRNPSGVCRGVKSMSVDGSPIQGNKAPLFGLGLHAVEVLLWVDFRAEEGYKGCNLMAFLAHSARVLVTLLLWPLAVCQAAALARLLWALPYREPRLIAFLSGVVAYALVQALFWKPIFLYVMGHELTHALASVLQGGAADDLRVSTRGGAVKVSRSNFVVSLAPYFFPLYTALILVVYWLSQERFRGFLAFGLGFSLAFHWALTAYSLRQHQSDIAEVGWLLALPLILSLNFAVLLLLLKAVLPEAVSLGAYARESLWFLKEGALRLRAAL